MQQVFGDAQQLPLHPTDPDVLVSPAGDGAAQVFRATAGAGNDPVLR